MKKILYLLLLITIAPKAFSQSKIENYELGYYFDINYQNIDGYFDIDYEPEKSLKLTYSVGEDFTPGYYYDFNNTKISGLLKYSLNNTYFKFKTDKESKEITIKPESCIGYVIGVDSFAVIVNFDVQREIGGIKSEKREFAEVIEKFGNYTFYKHTRIGLMGDFVITYLYSTNDSFNYISFPKSATKFAETAIPIFGEFVSLKNKILNGEYTQEDIPIMVKLLKYKQKFEKQEKIYFNSYWDEVDDTKKSSYYATINSIKDSVFHLSYFFNNNTPIYEGSFTSFYPNKKKGDFTWYYPNGAIRKITNYQYNKPLKTTTFFKNGKTHFEYNLVKNVPNYSKVCNINGEEILNASGCGTEIYYDSIAGRQLTNEYVNNYIVSSYYTDSSKNRIYLQCEKNAKLQYIGALQTRIENSLVYPENAARDSKHGFVLAKCIVEPDGTISDIKLIKNFDPSFEFLVSRCISYSQWRPAKVGKEKVRQEIIIPFDFSIKSFSRYRNNYNNFWMMNQMMMQQQMMQPQMPRMAPPRF